MESTRLGPRLSWSLLFQVTCLIAVSTWYTAVCQGTSTTAANQSPSNFVSTQPETTMISSTPQTPTTTTTVQTTTTTPAAPGKNCSINLDLQCVANATCNSNGICQCNSSFYSNSGSCLPKVAVNQNCSGSDSCADPNATCSTTCQCKSNFYYTGSVCAEKAALGKNCNRNGACLDPLALCASTCQCPSDYYNSNGTCVQKLPPGAACNSTDQCVGSANCSTSQPDKKTCTCFDSYYPDMDKNVCKQRHPPGAVCTNTIQCVQYANCSSSGVGGDGTCNCWDTHYNDSSEGVCKQKLPPGAACNSTDQCVGSANCSTSQPDKKTCTCFDSYYPDMDKNVCKQRHPPGAVCTNTIQCVQYANCSSSGVGGDGTCNCWDTHYNDSSEGVCKQKLPPGAACNSTDQCVGSANCSTSQPDKKTCTCFDSYYPDMDKNVCKQRHPPGAVCTNTIQCVQYANCSSSGVGGDGTCNCWDTHYNDSSEGVCKQSLGYGSTCTVGINNMCMVNLICRQNVNGSDSCLCNDKTFRYNNACQSVDLLKVLNVSRNSEEETNLNVTWSAPSLGQNLQYKVSLNNADNSVTNVTYFRFQNRTPGTLHTGSVITSVLRDPGYSTEKEDSPAVKKDFFTKPAKPGNLSQGEYPGPNVTLQFHKSEGGVDFYIVSITGTTLTANVTSQSNDPISAMFYNLTAGGYYSVTIVAHSGGISSDVTTGQFRVNPDDSGQVHDLNVTQMGSRWLDVEWGIPLMPNGVIMGYTVEVAPENNSTCVSGVAVVCSNCTYKNVMMPDTSNCTHNANKTQTRDQLQSNGIKQRANVTGLSPYVKYKVEVTPFNEKGAGQMDTKSFKTESEAAPNMVSLEALTSQNVGQLNVRWVPGEQTGNTSYNISWSEETSIGSNTFTYNDSYIAYGYERRTYDITGLLSYWNYNISVQPFTEIGPSPYVNHTVARTNDSEPGKVEDFKICQPDDSAQTLQFTVWCPREKNRNGIITSFIFRNQLDDKFVGHVEANDQCARNYTFTANVTAETNYNFTASAKTSRFEGPPEFHWWYVASKPPHLTPSSGFDVSLLKPPAQNEATQTTAMIKVCRCLFDKSQGAITLAGLIVCSNDNPTCDIKSADVNNTSVVVTWKKFRDSGYKGIYSPDKWHELQDASGSRKKRSAFLSRSIRATVDDVTYTLGSDVTCEQQNDSVYCNGPLPSGTKFVIKVFACTHGGCNVGSGIITIITIEKSDVNIGAIVGGVIGSLAALVLIVLIIVFVMRRRKSMEKPHKYVPATRKQAARHPIKLRDFRAHLDLLHSDSNLRFQEEFEDIQERSPKTYTHDAATTDANKVKNRYVNILPYDHTRVKLTTADDDESSDFINANYIPGYSSPREYIATQGPMTGTVDDFWRMIWEQKSGVIVMLSDLQEKGRPKVDLYWPTEPSSPVQYGDVIVELRSSSTLNKYTIRDFSISTQETQEKRKVLQFFIPGWEDYSANLDSDDVLDFVQAVRQQARTSRGPITVHCSAGVGRTGTFIALDFLMQYVNDHDLEAEVDIYNLVLNMRHNRPHMVQSEKQYIFIHDTLKVIIDKKIKAMQENENIYMNTDSADENIYANTNPAFELEESLYQNAETIWKPTTTL